MAGRIVVGVDGSESSRQALRWAAREARLTGAKLRVVMTWEVPNVPFFAPLSDGFDLEKDTWQALGEIVEEVVGRAGPDIETLVEQGHPAPVLVRESREADLLVVGSRGHGAFAGMLLGSVSRHCVTHSSCPVVVVRHAEAATA